MAFERHGERRLRVALKSAGVSIDFCGLGNIAGVIHSGRSVHSHGIDERNSRPGSAEDQSVHIYRYDPGATLIMHSDGLQTQWGLERYPGIMRHHPAIVAGALYRDYTRGRDDVTVLVLRNDCSAS